VVAVTLQAREFLSQAAVLDAQRGGLPANLGQLGGHARKQYAEMVQAPDQLAGGGVRHETP
jgi:hypothetical protein